jgi:hypothetical protein
MIVIFQRTGQRRYSIRVKRPQMVDLVMDPAPGYDPLMPHDLLHLVVESQLGLTMGVFGQLAAGGTAGSFRPVVDGHISAREGARLRTRTYKRGQKLLRDGKDDGLLSERAAYICWHQWLTRSASADKRKTAVNMNGEADHLVKTTPANKMRALDEKTLDQICRKLDDLSAHWSNLSIGESMTVAWPGLTVSSNKNES